MDESTRLFVYGTLAPGKENHDVMRDIDGLWERAVMKGTLISEGWGAAHGCPGVIPDASGADIAGYLFSAESLPLHWSRLDQFEGDDYRRQLVPVTISSGKQVNACVYAIRSRSGCSEEK